MGLDLDKALNIFNKADKLKLTLSTRLNLVNKIIEFLEEKEQYEDCQIYSKKRKELLKLKNKGKQMHFSRSELSNIVRNCINKQISK